MKLIATYIHDDHTKTKDHGEYTAHEVYQEGNLTWYRFECEWGEIEWNNHLVKSLVYADDATYIVIDWRN